MKLGSLQMRHRLHRLRGSRQAFPYSSVQRPQCEIRSARLAVLLRSTLTSKIVLEHGGVAGGKIFSIGRTQSRPPAATSLRPANQSIPKKHHHNPPAHQHVSPPKSGAPVSSRLHLPLRQHSRILPPKARSPHPPNRRRNTRSHARTRPRTSRRSK